MAVVFIYFFFYSSRRRHTRYTGDWSSDVCSSDLEALGPFIGTAGDQQLIVQGAAELAARWTECSAAALRRAVTILCGRITAQRERIDIEILAPGLYALLSGKPEGSEPVATANGRQLL